MYNAILDDCCPLIKRRKWKERHFSKSKSNKQLLIQETLTAQDQCGHNYALVFWDIPNNLFLDHLSFQFSFFALQIADGERLQEKEAYFWYNPAVAHTYTNCTTNKLVIIIRVWWTPTKHSTTAKAKPQIKVGWFSFTFFQSELKILDEQDVQAQLIIIPLTYVRTRCIASTRIVTAVIFAHSFIVHSAYLSYQER